MRARRRLILLAIASFVVVGGWALSGYVWTRSPSLSLGEQRPADQWFRSDAEHDALFSFSRAPIVRIEHPSGGSLYYFGTCHTNAFDHPMMGFLQKAIGEHEPTVVLHESRMGFYFGGPRAGASRFGEAAVVWWTGRDHGAKVYSLEPGETDHARALAERVGRQEALAYLALRMAHGENPEGPITENELVHALEKRGVGVLADAFTGIDDFELFWSRKWQDELGDWRTLRWLLIGTEGSFGEVGRLDTVLRDVHMANLLAEHVAAGERVFAAVGRSHVIVQEPAFAQLLPDAEISVEFVDMPAC